MSTTTKQIALVTGANRGIGFTLAQTLARDHGFHVIMASRTTSSGAEAVAKLQAEKLSVEGVAVDLTSDASITAAADTVSKKHGHIDVLVNNAGILLDFREVPNLEGTRKVYQDTYNTNVFGTAIVTAAFVPLLSKSSHPRVVFVSSTMGSTTDRLNPNSRYAWSEADIYSTSKAAMNLLAATYARKSEFKDWKINVACPGGVKTGLNDFADELVKTTEDAMGNLVRLCTLGKDGETGTFSDDEGPVPW